MYFVSGFDHFSCNRAELPEGSKVQDNLHEQLNKRPIVESCDNIWRLENIYNEITQVKLYGTSVGNLEMKVHKWGTIHIRQQIID